MSIPSGPDELVVVSNRVKSRITGFILVAAIIAFTLAVNLPYRYVALKGQWIGSGDIESRGGPGLYMSLPEMAGWPFNYQVTYPDGQRQNRFFSAFHLLLNITLGFAAAALTYAFIQWRHGQVQRRFRTGWNRWIPDLGIALAIIVLPGSIVAFHFVQYRQNMELASRVARHGNCYVSCWLPESIVDYVPEGMKTWMSRVRWISIGDFREKPQLETDVCDIPTLVGLSVRRHGVRPTSILRLQQHLHFQQLMLNDAELESDHVKAIRQLPWLSEISFNGSNLNGEMLRYLDAMPLVAVDLSNTDLPLSDIGRPGWADTVIKLTLSRPAKGVSDSLVIDDWPKLESLMVTRFVIRANEAPLTLELIDLPKLEYLRIDRLQKHRLVLRNVPRLAEIDDGIGHFGYVLDRSMYIPGQTWVSRIDVENAPSLQMLTCFARDLESMTIRDTPNLHRFALGSYLTSMLGDRQKQPANSDRCQEWVNMIGEQDGPGTVDLQMLPLAGVDLSPLANNHRIRILNLDLTEISFDQLQTLAGMEQLEHLDVRSCRLRQDELAWLLKQFEQLENLMVDGSGLKAVDLSQPLRLKRLLTRRLVELERLRMVDMPRLGTELRLMQAPQLMEVRNVQGLRGLGLEQDPWPTHARVVGLRDLEWFAAGGPAVNDALMDELLGCRLMDKLTLAYGDVSPQKLKRVSEFPKLTVLALPGADVDDEVTESWSELAGLLDINLDDTRVGAATIARLSSIKPLRRLSLRRVPLDSSAIEGLARMQNLSQLILAEVPIPPEQLSLLFQLPELESLDLSGAKVDESWIAMVQHSSVQHLILHDCDISPELLRKMLDAKPTLYVDLGRIPDEVDDQTVMELRDRAKQVVASFRQGWQQVFAIASPFTVDVSSLHGGWEAPEDLRLSVTVGMPRAIGRIDLEQFRPK